MSPRSSPMRARSVARWVALTALACALPALAARAQSVRGRVTHGQGGAVSGVVLLLVDSTGSAHARALSGDDGRFVLRALRPGRYQIRALRVGFTPSVSGQLDLRAGEAVERDVAVAEIPVQLETIRVAGRPTCAVTPAAGRAALTVWNEARTALLAAVITEESRALDATIALFEQRLSPRDERVLRQVVALRRVPTVRPFATLPPDELARAGFARADEDSTTYVAPDANVMLSADFGGAHCLRIASRDSLGWIGLEFEPVSRREGVVDIAGTLWLDRRTAELRVLTFRYTNVPRVVSDAGAGGRLELARLADGGWVVSRWALRLPVVTGAATVGGRFAGWEVPEVAVTGGALVETRAEGSVVWRGSLASVSGAVSQQEGGAPVGGAVVSLAGTDYLALTDSLGTFVIPDVVAGSYRIEVNWAPLDSMGIVSHARRELVVPDSGEEIVRLQTPTLDAGLALVCGRDAARQRQAMIRGVLRAPDGSPVKRGTRVSVAWNHVVTNASGEQLLREGTRAARTDALGRFTLCGVPRDTPLDLRAPATTATRLEVIVPATRPFAWQPVTLPTPPVATTRPE